MNRLLVIADDLTGAAEIGGIAVARGLSARIVLRASLVAAVEDADVVILDTNTRQLAPAAAAEALTDIAPLVVSPRFPRLYKKVDSALRGPVAAEIDAVLRAGRCRRAILIPQNPSRGRVIVDGQYLIDGVPLDQTFMARDPEHPADTADALRRLGRFADTPVTLVPTDGDLPVTGIALCDAADLTTIQRRAAEVDTTTLPVGGADFFRAVLGGQQTQPPEAPRRDRATLVICGSACERSRSEVATRAAGGGLVIDFPFALCGDATRDRRVAWAHDAAARVRSDGSAWVAARGSVADGWAAHLRTAMADAIVHLLEHEPTIDHVLIEGGATAAAIAERAGWTSLVVERELAGGVVSVRPVGADGSTRRPATVVLKPGSYAWPTGSLPGSGRGS
jgi:uncharacterized protein YgbK (DUF1537 family)